MPTFMTNDDVTLYYSDTGKGIPVILIHGWSQSSEQYKYQIEDLSLKYRVIALDMRGHGKSEKVKYGYNLYRFSKDIHELIEILSLKKVVLAGHGNGAGVIFCFLELFGSNLLYKLILIDRIPVLLSNPLWTAKELQDYGSIVDSVSAIDYINGLSGANGDSIKKIMLNRQISSNIKEEDKKMLYRINAAFSCQIGAAIVASTLYDDFRDIFLRITLPTLIIGGEASLTSVSSQKWLHKQIKYSELVIFEEHEGGKHFMFLENPVKFNRIINKFIED